MTYRLPDADDRPEPRDPTTYRLPNGTSLGGLHMDRLAALADLAAADEALCDAVVFAHEHDGLSWAQIGDAIGIDRHAVRWFASKHAGRKP